MSNVARVAGQAANTLVKPLDVDELFSTYLYTGNGSTQTITNGIDLAGEGGLVAIKRRDADGNWGWYDTERGPDSHIKSNGNNAEQTTPDVEVKDFNSNGFDLGTNWNAPVNTNNAKTCSWTFRKAPKFFDVVTYTGTGSAQTNIPHNLNADIGMIVIKRTDNTSNWFVWHRGNGSSDYTSFELNSTETAGQVNPNYYDKFTSTTFRPTYVYDKGFANANINGATYVAYLFAHNDGDGDFGPDGDADIIKCGSYTGTSSSSTINQIDLGFEPQWLLIKGADYPTGWQLYDNMRVIATGSNDARLYADTSAAENYPGDVDVNANGFAPALYSLSTNYQGKEYIYVAIRRPTAVPTSATDVFEPAVQGVSGANPTYPTGIVTDFSLTTSLGVSDKKIMTRLLGATELVASDTSQEGPYTNAVWDYMNGWGNEANQTNKYSWAWKRAPNYFDVVAYTGASGADTVSHNLGVVPEMIWVKNRDDAGMAARQNWVVYHASASSGYLNLHNTNALQTSDAASKFGNGSSLVAPTADDFTVADDYDVGRSGYNYIAYLFATLAGISKVGSVSHTTGSNTDVDCGFSAGARFVILKGTHASGWQVFDTERGIVAGNDATLTLHSTSAEDSSQDRIDPYSSGFSIGPDLATGDYIFYAIA
jgi:hypothetical protein